MTDYKAKFEAERSWRHKYACTARDWIIDERDECQGCLGSGYLTYGDTSTWRGGGGGSTLTTDVCDKCWGSGSKAKAWPSHRLLSLTSEKDE